jgi:hypothetical protein
MRPSDPLRPLPVPAGGKTLVESVLCLHSAPFKDRQPSKNYEMLACWQIRTTCRRRERVVVRGSQRGTPLTTPHLERAARLGDSSHG